MNITVNTQVLAQELRLINKVVASKPTLPILMNVLLSADGEALRFFGTDLEVGFLTACVAQVAQPGMMTVPAKKLLDMVEQLPDTSVRIWQEKQHVRISSGNFNSRLQAMSAEDFPKMPALEGEAAVLSGTGLRSLIGKVRYAVAEKSTKYTLDGAKLMLAGTQAALASTDGKRLSLATMTRQEGPEQAVIIPSKALDALMLQDDPEVEFSTSKQHLFFTSGHRLLLSRMIDGKFPAYDRIIPRDNDKKAIISRSLFAAALKRVGLVSENNQATYFSFAPGSLEITSSSHEVGDAHEAIAIDYSGDVIKVCASWQFVLDFLEAAAGANIVAELKDNNTPMLLTDGTDFLNVVMLMRS